MLKNSFVGFGLDIQSQSRDLGVAWYLTPTALVASLGLITIVFMGAVFFAYENASSDPLLLIMSEFIVVIVSLFVGGFVIHSIEKIARANKIKSDFITLISNQLKDPLLNIQWIIEDHKTTHGKYCTEKHREVFDRIEMVSKEITMKVTDYLSVAQIENGLMVIRKEPVDVGVVVKEEIGHFSFLAKKKGITISYSCRTPSPVILGNKKQIGLVSGNLISNAIKYTSDQGDVHVYIEEKEGMIRVCVVDTGIGISTYQQDCIFDKFFRSENGMQCSSEGTGLGLYLSKQIVEEHGGKIWFTSRENIGSSFCFQIEKYDVNNLPLIS